MDRLVLLPNRKTCLKSGALVVRAHKAQRNTSEDPETRSLVIRVEDEIPDRRERDDGAFDADARDLVDALFACLPMGTLDRILVRMLDKKKSSLVVKSSPVGPDEPAVDDATRG